ncbi:MAG: ATP-binding cassette domain-containing protein [Bacteroidaceae bacterium]|nr:ATP-binding cassette domain-containing protein [Bacteroidaceae bacterium]
MDNFTIRLENGIVCNPEVRLAEPVNIQIKKGQQIAVCGPNGAGKTLLVNILLRQYPLLDKREAEYGPDIHGGDIRSITFRDSYGSADSTYYYQQRWNMTEMGDSPIVADAFPFVADNQWKDSLFSLFDLSLIWDKQLVTLSSGEMRKYQLARSLAVKPKIIIIDSPFIGLDRETREMLCGLLKELVDKWGMQIILVVARREDIPDFITHVIEVKDKICKPIITREAYMSAPVPEAPTLSKDLISLMHSLPEKDMDSSEIVRCNKVNLRYGSRHILDQLDWTINKGEHWALLGRNGCGKSALLSLIFADNPQSYASDIALFGRARGTGESIWEIKKHIGYVSPEMHRSYSRHYPAIDIVASGLHDSVGLYKKITNEERESCRAWLKIFGVSHLEDRDFYYLSSGEQRMILLARAFVKNPSLIILDEPLHGLDFANRSLAMQIIKAFCDQPQKTMIIVTHYPEELPDTIDHQLKLIRH